MKQKTQNYKRAFCSGAIIAASAAALLWLWLAHCPDGAPHAVHSASKNMISEACALITHVASASLRIITSKRSQQTSSRRMEFDLCTPSFFPPRNTIWCRTAYAVPPTPALHPAVSPATFVRAGPENTAGKYDGSNFQNNKKGI